MRRSRAQAGSVNNSTNHQLPSPALTGESGRQRFSVDGCVMPGRTGLQFSRPISFSSWELIGSQLSLIADSSAWWLGDWLVYGERKYANRYKRAVERTDLDYQTLRNYAWVSRRFPLARRREKLTFGHHAEVAALPGPEQDLWLRRAERHSWSRNQLRRELRSAIASGSTPARWPSRPGLRAEDASSPGRSSHHRDKAGHQEIGNIGAASAATPARSIAAESAEGTGRKAGRDGTSEDGAVSGAVADRGAPRDDVRRTHLRSSGETAIRAEVGDEMKIILERLTRDPAMKLSEAGRDILRILYICANNTQKLNQLIGKVPPHRTAAVARLANMNAIYWKNVAMTLEGEF
jgi:hypothetical protein